MVSFSVSLKSKREAMKNEFPRFRVLKLQYSSSLSSAKAGRGNRKNGTSKPRGGLQKSSFLLRLLFVSLKGLESRVARGVNVERLVQLELLEQIKKVGGHVAELQSDV